MIGQYLSNKNESATLTKSEIFWELNKASELTEEAGRLSRAATRHAGTAPAVLHQPPPSPVLNSLPSSGSASRKLAKASRARASGALGSGDLPLLLLSVASVCHESDLTYQTFFFRQGVW